MSVPLKQRPQRKTGTPFLATCWSWQCMGERLRNMQFEMTSYVLRRCAVPRGNAGIDTDQGRPVTGKEDQSRQTVVLLLPSSNELLPPVWFERIEPDINLHAQAYPDNIAHCRWPLVCATRDHMSCGAGPRGSTDQTTL